ncbi:MAG TPA: DUF3551 domain-containing protein [Pseudolabrys sp.]|nr:DUF3551 domain-containing protein [Pseudolabrys sp.]
MRKTLLAMAAFAAASAFAPPPAQAVEYPWCAQYGGRGGDGGRNCGFVSFEQCMATVSGIGGFCERNLFYKGPERVHKPRRRIERY